MWAIVRMYLWCVWQKLRSYWPVWAATGGTILVIAPLLLSILNWESPWQLWALLAVFLVGAASFVAILLWIIHDSDNLD